MMKMLMKKLRLCRLTQVVLSKDGRSSWDRAMGAMGFESFVRGLESGIEEAVGRQA